LSRTFSLFAILTIVCAIVAGVHYYFWIRLVRDTQLSGIGRQFATTGIISLAILVLAAASVGRIVPRVGRLLAWPGFMWMGMMFMLLLVLASLDIVRLSVALVGRLSGAAVAMDPSRRTFVARFLAGSALATLGGLAAAAVVSTLRDVSVKRLEITLDRLPQALDGLKIVQLCDLHIGGTLGHDFVDQVVRRTNELNPDVVAIVGDLVDGSVSQLRPALAPLLDLKAAHGIFFVTGNHEYYTRSGGGGWMSEIERMGFRVLRNERVAIGTEQASFDLAGVPDHGAVRFPDDGPSENVPLAMAGRDPSRAVVLLAHQPIAIHQAARLGVDLQLSGHTHGGQIWPWGALVRLQQPYIRGLHRIGETQLYVSCGTGYWGPPMRLGAPAEITEIILRARRPMV
jgi:predicted MPP superfamily phosphohydrolase